MADARKILKLSAIGVIGYGLYKTFTGVQFSPTAPDAQAASAISTNGIALIQQQEGFSSTAYPDGAGYSIGYGHQIVSGDGLSASSKITQAQGVSLLTSDVQAVTDAINSLVTVPLSQNQFDALADFVYNIGRGAFAGSTLLADLNAGDYLGASAQFALWNIANGVHNDVLSARRAVETSLFTS